MGLIQQILEATPPRKYVLLDKLLGMKVRKNNQTWTVTGLRGGELVDLTNEAVDHWDNVFVGNLELIEEISNGM